MASWFDNAKKSVSKTFQQSQLGKDWKKGNYLGAVGDAAYHLSGVGDIKTGVNEIKNKGNWKGGLASIALGGVQMVPGLGLAGGAVKIGSKAAKVGKIANVTKVDKVGQKLIDYGNAPRNRIFLKDSDRIISKFAPNTVNKNAFGYIPAAQIGYKEFKSELAPVKTQGTSFTQPMTIAGQVQTTAKPKTTKPKTTSNTSTTSASIPANNSNQIYAGGTSTAPAYQAPESYPINPAVPSIISNGPVQMPNPSTMQTPLTPAVSMPGYTPAGAGGYTDSQNAARIDAQNASTGTTVDTSGTAQTGLSPQVQAQNAAYGAALKQAAAEANIRLQNISNSNMTGQQQVMGQAADIYGGRAPAILGQGLEGNARNLQVNMGEEALTEARNQGALASGYDEAIRKAVEKQYADMINIAQNRAAQVAQMTKVQGGRI